MDSKQDRAQRRIQAGFRRYMPLRGTPAGLLIGARCTYIAMRVYHGYSPRTARWAIYVALFKRRTVLRFYMNYLFLFRPTKFQRIKRERKL